MTSYSARLAAVFTLAIHFRIAGSFCNAPAGSYCLGGGGGTITWVDCHPLRYHMPTRFTRSPVQRLPPRLLLSRRLRRGDQRVRRGKVRRHAEPRNLGLLGDLPVLPRSIDFRHFLLADPVDHSEPDAERHADTKPDLESVAGAVDPLADGLGDRHAYSNAERLADAERDSQSEPKRDLDFCVVHAEPDAHADALDDAHALADAEHDALADADCLVDGHAVPHPDTEWIAARDPVTERVGGVLRIWERHCQPDAVKNRYGNGHAFAVRDGKPDAERDAAGDADADCI